MSTLESILSNVETTLEGVSISGGYNNDLSSAQVTREVKNFRDNEGYDRFIVILYAGERKEAVDIANYIDSWITVRIEGRVRSSSDLETKVNQLLEDIETVLSVDRTRNGYAHDTFPKSVVILNGRSDDELLFRYDFEVYYSYSYGSP